MTACRVVTFEERASGCGAGSSRSAWRRLSLKSNPQAKCVKWADTTRCSEPQSITACAVGVFYRGIFLRADSGAPPTSPSFTDVIHEGASRPEEEEEEERSSEDSPPAGWQWVRRASQEEEPPADFSPKARRIAARAEALLSARNTEEEEERSSKDPPPAGWQWVRRASQDD